MPSASSTSAWRVALLACNAPARETRPSDSGCSVSIAPMPLIECATGICSFSASAFSSSVARENFTPWPTMITGRSADSSMSTAFTTPSGSAPQRDEMLALHSCAFGGSSAAASSNTSNGTSSTTGPGRPVTMVFQAWRTIIGTCSPRVG